MTRTLTLSHKAALISSSGESRQVCLFGGITGLSHRFVVFFQNFQLVPLPVEEYGTFFKGDSYIVICVSHMSHFFSKYPGGKGKNLLSLSLSLSCSAPKTVKMATQKWHPCL